MKRIILAIVLAFISMTATAGQVFNLSNCEARFSPNGKVDEMIIQSIDDARWDIRMLAYSFTRLEIAEALARAHKRGVDVQVILDRSQDTYRYSQFPILFDTGIPTYFDKKHAIAHNKVILIDKVRVLTGSYNFSQGAEFKNAENFIRCTSREGYKQYLADWLVHKEHSLPGTSDNLYVAPVK